MPNKLMFEKWDAAEEVLEECKKEFEIEGYDVEFQKNNADQLVLKVSDSSGGFLAFLRNICGLSASTTLIASKLNKQDVRLKTFGRWWDKMTVAFISLLVLWPLTITSIIGIVRQNKLSELVHARVTTGLANSKHKGGFLR